jgi:ATP-dependent 26S proteasome regulatory subunit
MISGNTNDLKSLIKSRIPIINIDSFEEQRLLKLIKVIVDTEHWNYYVWSVTNGLCEYPSATEFVKSHLIEEALNYIKTTDKPGIYVLLDIEQHIKNPIPLRVLKEIAENYDRIPKTIIFLEGKLALPDDLNYLCAKFTPRLPNKEHIHEIYLEQAYRWLNQHKGRVIYRSEDIESVLLQNLSGFNEDDVERLIYNAISDDGRINNEDIQDIVEFKKQSLGKDGLVEFYPSSADLNEVGGLEHLKSWLELRRQQFVGTHQSVKLDVPKGILLLGVQGCGKSVAAKAVAKSWNVPLLRLDFGTLYSKWLGESERNIRLVIKQAEAMAPCVLWIDELEKGLSTDSGGSTDGGVSKRLLSTILVWMAERTERVFLIATANDVSALPPELLRKGRFDEIFFIDLPNFSTRKDIFKIHLKKREQESRAFNLAELATLSANFSGSEIEQAIVSAMYRASNQSIHLNNSHIVFELQHTRPLSVIMAEKITSQRQWAVGRTVYASDVDSHSETELAMS